MTLNQILQKMRRMKHFAITRAQHAYLFKRYCMTASEHVTVGDSQGDYGRKDSETDSYFKCLGESRGKKVAHSSDLKPGLFYPATVFVWGVDDNGDSLPHEQVELFCKQIRYTSHSRCLLPRGYAGGRWTWDNAVYFSPPEQQPHWFSMEALLKQQFPGADIECRECYCQITTE